MTIPCNRGCLILAGISLNTRRNINGVDLDTASREMIIRGLINIITNQKNGLAPYDRRKSIILVDLKQKGQYSNKFCLFCLFTT